MRKVLIKALIFLGILVLGVVVLYNIFLLAQDKSKEETYISKVLIQASWGEKNLLYDEVASKPGEFGYYVSEETEVAPNTFAVAPNGDIYISDPLNKRVQIFNSQGELINSIPITFRACYICVDHQNNIYIARYRKKKGYVYKYDQKGELLKTYSVFTGVSHTGQTLYCDKSGRIFMTARGVGIFQIGTTEEAYTIEKQKTTAIDGFAGANSSALDKDQLFQKSFWRSYFLVSSITKDTLKVFTSLQGGLWGMDEDGAIYTFNSLGESRNYIVRKYDQNENLISSFKMSYTRPWVCGERSSYLDNEGNVYFFIYSGKEGLQIIKWYKK